jgi:hypothetical protein
MNTAVTPEARMLPTPVTCTVSVAPDPIAPVKLPVPLFVSRTVVGTIGKYWPAAGSSGACPVAASAGPARVPTIPAFRLAATSAMTAHPATLRRRIHGSRRDTLGVVLTSLLPQQGQRVRTPIAEAYQRLSDLLFTISFSRSELALAVDLCWVSRHRERHQICMRVHVHWSGVWGAWSAVTVSSVPGVSA